MKRILLFTLAVVLLLTFAACGSGETSGSVNEGSSESVDANCSVGQGSVSSDDVASDTTDVEGSTVDSTEDSKTDESTEDSTGSSTESSVSTESSSIESDKPNSNIPSTDSSVTDKPDDEDVNEKTFKVYLDFNGSPFVQEEGAPPIIVSWSDGLSFVEAEINNDGYAIATGLDGDYTVTLKNIPDGYAYDPNPYNEENDTYGYEVTNDSPEITIDIYKIGTTKGAGSTSNNRMSMTRTGVYRATLTDAGHKIFFEFAPKSSGTYTIESWVSVMDDKVNPKVDVYTSNFAAPIFQYTIDTGGAEGKYYTKNFRYDVEIADEMISSGGQVVFVFAIHATARNNRYFPINVDFAIKYEGGFELNHTQSEFMVPEKLYEKLSDGMEQLKQLSFEAFFEEYSVYNMDPDDTYGVAYYHYLEAKASYESSKKDKAFEEYYSGFATTQEMKKSYEAYVEVSSSYNALQALSTATMNNSLSLNHFLNGHMGMRQIAIGYLRAYFNTYYNDTAGKTWKNPSTPIGSKLVLIGEGYEFNSKTGFYHKYDENLYENDPYGYGKGFGPILYADITTAVRTGVLGDPFTTIEYHGNKALTVSDGTENYKLFIESYEKANAMTVQVLGGEIECDEALKNLIGYATIVNSDGAAPVTEELMDFLQKYAINQAMFMDGDGWAERAENPYQAAEEYQWLFACGYYE